MKLSQQQQQQKQQERQGVRLYANNEKNDDYSKIDDTNDTTTNNNHNDNNNNDNNNNAKDTTIGMKRPLLDRLFSSQVLYQLEMNRVEASSELDDRGRYGEPMEWSDSNSWPNRISKWIQDTDIGYRFKQYVADKLAGFDGMDSNDDINNENAISSIMKQTEERIDDFVTSNPVAIFSFSTCPFCRRVKDYLEDHDIPYASIELDELDGNEGNQIRAMLGRKTRRTSVPAIYIGGTYIGGCNDGNPGLMPLVESGELNPLLIRAGIQTN